MWVTISFSRMTLPHWRQWNLFTKHGLKWSMQAKISTADCGHHGVSELWPTGSKHSPRIGLSAGTRSTGRDTEFEQINCAVGHTHPGILMLLCAALRCYWSLMKRVTTNASWWTQNILVLSRMSRKSLRASTCMTADSFGPSVCSIYWNQVHLVTAVFVLFV
jgi:hypothetical protein